MVTQVRPTLRALRLLPAGDEGVAEALNVIGRARRATDTAAKRAILSELRLDELRHPLLEDVRTTLERGGTPDTHETSSRAAKRTVYEARSRTGAAWRGAVVLEDDVMWLVFADVHDRFHSTAADYLKKGDWLPGVLDAQHAAHDAERACLGRWRVRAVVQILDALREAVCRQRPVELRLDDPAADEPCVLRLEVEHEEPAPTADLAHTTSGLLEVTLLIRRARRELVHRVLRVLDLVRDGAGLQDQAFLPGGDLLLLSTVSHARLTQLTATVDDTTDIVPGASALPDPAVLHYVNTARLAAGFVDGTAVLSLCGEWFVPRVDGAAHLPVCRACEERKPLAQALLDGLRS